MPTFKYAGVTAEGQRVRGRIEGYTPDGVLSELAERGLEKVRLRRKFSEIEILAPKVKRANLMHFSRQLSAFLRAGVPILDSLELLEEEASDKALRKLIPALTDALRRGETFADAVAPFHKAFPPFYVAILGTAELTGRLDTVLEQLAGYVERDLEARRKIRSALAYPAIVMVLSIITSGVLVGFVLPRFKVFFESLDATLPLPTRMLLAVADFVTRWGLVALLVLGLVVLGLAVSMTTIRGKWARDKVLLKLPVIGNVVRYAVIERFCRLMASMFQAGIPLPEAISVAGQGAGNQVFLRGLAEVRQSMLEGEGLAGPISRSELFPKSATQMMRVGEETGTLDDQLQVTARFFEQELEYKIKNLTNLFEPAAIIFMGVIVGFVAIAVVSAMYGIYNQVDFG